MLLPDEEIKMLVARIDDLLVASDRGACVYSRFLSPRERHYSEIYIGERGASERCFYYGGCGGCERTRLFILPEYLVGMLGDGDGGAVGVCPEETGEAVVCVSVIGSGFGRRRLTHRDYLGACLGLGISRDKLGDIAILPEERGRSRAYLFCDRVSAQFICENLNSVGSEGVKAEISVVPDGLEIKPELERITGTVASARLDCIVAEAASLSRERAKELICAGLAEVNYETCAKTDRVIATPFTLSVRGYGKYIIRDCSEPTKKGRYRLVADKYK